MGVLAPRQDVRDFRDFRIYDKLDVRFGREWKQAEVMEVDWEETPRTPFQVGGGTLGGHQLWPWCDLTPLRMG